jgi:hypothetical protein
MFLCGLENGHDAGSGVGSYVGRDEGEVLNFNVLNATCDEFS